MTPRSGSGLLLTCASLLAHLTVFCTFAVPSFARPVESDAGVSGAAADMRIDGRVLEGIDVAFKDYLTVAPPELRRARYYVFSARQEGNAIVVKIEFNRDVLLKEMGRWFRGGSAKYVIGLDGFVIRERMLYK